MKLQVNILRSEEKIPRQKTTRFTVYLSIYLFSYPSIIANRRQTNKREMNITYLLVDYVSSQAKRTANELLIIYNILSINY